MDRKPNVLILMCDQLRADILKKDSLCITPGFDSLLERGVWFNRGYTTNPVCSPARASLMTGLLPHNHGVIHVTHTVNHQQQAQIIPDNPHFAQVLSANGYNTGYFGKWHVDRDGDATRDLTKWGWQVSPAVGETTPKKMLWANYNPSSVGYDDKNILFGTTSTPKQERPMGRITTQAHSFLDEHIDDVEPWCCFVSVPEPHDPYICHQDYYDLYNIDDIELSENCYDDLKGKPNIYKRIAGLWKDMKDEDKRKALACYFASITEIDELYGSILDRIYKSGASENTIIILTADHGDMMGSHGVYCKNIGAWQEAYNIPIVIAAPGCQKGSISNALVGIADICPSILELTGHSSFEGCDSKSFMPLLFGEADDNDFNIGYAEYEGTRFQFTQRLVWHGDWKYVFNPFDFDELYHLKNDPQELENLAADTKYRDVYIDMMKLMWKKIRDTGDKTLENTQYPALRLGDIGPLV